MLLPLRDGHALHAHQAGTGPPILMVHGFAGSGKVWGAAALRAVGRMGRAIVIDLLGHGRSGAPRDPDRYAMGEIVADVIELLDALEIERATWIGYSMGGRVALAAAVTHPARCDRLILESASPGLASAEERAARRRSDAELAETLEARGAEWFAGYWAGLPLFATRARLDADARAAIRDRLAANDAHALAACLRGLGTGSMPPLWDALPALDVPTLLVTGAEDARFTAIAGRMAEQLPEARHVAVPDAGHTVHLEQPERWGTAVVDGW